MEITSQRWIIHLIAALVTPYLVNCELWFLIFHSGHSGTSRACFSSPWGFSKFLPLVTRRKVAVVIEQ